MIRATTKGVFLTAKWEKLAMANYAVDASLLLPYLPYKTEIDRWNGTCYVSLVGFIFSNTRLRGFRVPYHTRFEEVNLRFYVKYNDGQQWKRGVVFISEIVPLPALALVANTFYNEKYRTMPMSHQWLEDDNSLTVDYRWKYKKWNSFSVTTGKEHRLITEGSEEAFITEHYWGYTGRSVKRSSEYGVEHPKWEVYPTKHYTIDADFAGLYGESFGFLRNQTPLSVFVAEGSDVLIRQGSTII